MDLNIYDNEFGEPAFFHSKCCSAHFEGVIISGKMYFACEKCRKVLGEFKEPKFIRRELCQNQ